MMLEMETAFLPNVHVVIKKANVYKPKNLMGNSYEKSSLQSKTVTI